MSVLLNGDGRLFSWIRKEVELEETLRRGRRGQAVRRLQEWLTLRGHGTAVDGDFGPATQAALVSFQEAFGLSQSGEANSFTFETLIDPLIEVLTPFQSAGETLGEMVSLYGRAHLELHPREVGGQNMGPWVRLYMEGNEGPPWAWCAGFVKFVVRQAAETLDIEIPIRGSFSCDRLADQAMDAGLFVKATELESRFPGGPPAPSVFLVRRTADDWTHTGFVTAFHDGFFETIEGNTNDDGSREGFEVCARTRGYDKKDFIPII